MPATVAVDIKKGDRITLRPDKANCTKTLQTLLAKNGLTSQHLAGGIKVLSNHGGTLRAEHPVSGRPCTVNTSIFQRMAA